MNKFKNAGLRFMAITVIVAAMKGAPELLDLAMLGIAFMFLIWAEGDTSDEPR